MEYQELEIDIRSVEGGKFEATVTQAPTGDRPRVVFAPPLDDAVLEQVLGQGDYTDPAERPEIDSWSIGQQLSSALFQEELRDLFLKCCSASPEEQCRRLRLRLKFHLEDPAAEYLAALPWEWLCHPETGKFLANDVSFSVLRVLGRLHQALRVVPPLRILVVDAAPVTMKRLALKLEIERIREALKSLIEEGMVQLFKLKEISPEALRDALRDGSFHVLHFMGHGGYDSGSGMGAVFFEAADGSEDQVDGEMLAAVLKDIAELRLVVLNSCKSARHSGKAEAPLYSGVASAILDQTGIPAVIANQYSISDSAAIAFSQAFYRRLAAGDSVETAMGEARLKLGLRSSEWATTVLFLSAPDGRIFELDRSAHPVTVPEVVEIGRSKETSLPLGIRSLCGLGEDMPERTDEMLDLGKFFEGRDCRFIRDPKLWQAKVFPELEQFLFGYRNERRPLVLDFAAHSSIAFAAGWVLDAKSGLDIRVRQRIMGKREVEWGPYEGRVPEGSLWQERPDLEIAADRPDIAVAVSISQPNVAEEVRVFIEENGLPVGRIIDATIAPEPGPGSVQGGQHALRLAQSLAHRLRLRRPAERRGCLHLFCASPNAFMFYLGQLSPALGQMVLYEYMFKSPGSFGRYERAIELPPPDEVKGAAGGPVAAE